MKVPELWNLVKWASQKVDSTVNRQRVAVLAVESGSNSSVRLGGERIFPVDLTFQRRGALASLFFLLLRFFRRRMEACAAAFAICWKFFCWPVSALAA